MVEAATIVRYTTLYMDSGITQEALGIAEISSIKNKMAVAYMHALNSTVNYHFQENTRDMDGLGFDFTIASKTVGTKRTIASGANQINVQLKSVAMSSTSMFSETSTHIKYRLTDDLLPIGLALFLVIVVLPPDIDIENWRVVGDEDVLLKARGYYVRVEEVLSSGTIEIPKTQILNPVTYRQMFEIPSMELAP